VTDAGDIASDNSKVRVAPDRLLRDRSRDSRVTNIELFFDLVYVFAVTQLSHHLLSDPTLRGDRAGPAGDRPRRLRRRRCRRHRRDRQGRNRALTPTQPRR
jgi:hypothetical protein